MIHIVGLKFYGPYYMTGQSHESYCLIHMKWWISVEEDGDGSHWIRLQSRRSSTNDREPMRRSQTEQFELSDMIVYKL